ncbi:MAG: DUF397 domain-containing protein [Actinomycetota bacterium]
MQHSPTSPLPLAWRKASFSGNNAACVEVADAGDDILVRNSKRPTEGTLAFTRAEMDAWIAGCKAGEFDDLA